MNDHAYSVMSGEVGPNENCKASWAKFDEIISRFLIEQKVPGAVIAVTKNGKILYKQGYGIAGGSKRVQADSLFRIASISKPITSVAVQRLCEQYHLSLDCKVFGKKGILKRGKYRDKRVSSITVKHLLQHSAGWDRDKVGDAVFVRPQCVINHHPDSSDFNNALLKYALRRRLQFTPGSQHAYSNLGYLILGMVIEEVSNQPYHVFMSQCLQQSGITGIQLGSWKRAAWSSKEVEYFNNREPEIVSSLFPGYGQVLPQYGGMAMASSGSYGGLVSNAHSLLTFLHKMSCACAGGESQCTCAGGESQCTCAGGESQCTCAGGESQFTCAGGESQCTCAGGESQCTCAGGESQCTCAGGESQCTCAGGESQCTCAGDESQCTCAGGESQFTCAGGDSQCTCAGGESQFTCGREEGSVGCEKIKDPIVWSENDGYITFKKSECSSDRIKKDFFAYGKNKDICSRENIPPCLNRELDSTSAPPWDVSESDRIMACHSEFNCDSSIPLLHVQPASRLSNFIDCDCGFSQNLCSDEFHHCSRYLCLNLARYEHVENETKCVTSSYNENTVSSTYEHDIKSVFNNQDYPETRNKIYQATKDKLNDRPLLSKDQTENSFKRPLYENGPDWYGLGWDVEDNGQSWGHTGAMEGTCGTMYHHASGVDWVFLLNSWAFDDDLNGVMKCALSTVSDLALFNSLISSSSHGCCVKITSENQQQVIFLGLCEFCVQESVSSMKSCGYFLTWISALSQNCLGSGSFSTSVVRVSLQPVALSYVLLFSKLEETTDYVVVFNVTEKDLREFIEHKAQTGYEISFVDSFSLNDELRFSAVFKLRKDKNGPRVIFLSLKAKAYVKQIKQLVKSHFIKSQSVTQIGEHMIVSVILEKRSNSSYLNSGLATTIYWVQITPESFLTELKRQVSRGNGLTYVKFFTVDHKAYASGCWSPTESRNTFHRTSVSKYGLVPELAEAAAKNVQLQSVSEYEEDGLVHYAAFWFAG